MKLPVGPVGGDVDCVAGETLFAVSSFVLDTDEAGPAGVAGLVFRLDC